MASLALLSALALAAQQTSLHCLIPTEYWERRFRTGANHQGHNGPFSPMLTPEPCALVALSSALATADHPWTPCAPLCPKRIPGSSVGRTS